MVRRGRRRWRLQLGLWRLGRDHRCGGGGGWLSERCPAHSARAPGPGTRRGPGRAARAREAVPPAKRRSGEVPAAPAASSQRRALRLAAQSWLHTLAPGPPPPPSRALPELRPKSWHTPPSGCKGGRRGPGAAGSTPRTVRREERGSWVSSSLPVPGACPGDSSRGGAATAGAGFAQKAAVCVSRSKRPRVNLERRAGAPCWRRGARGGGLDRRSLPSPEGAPEAPPGVQRDPRSRML